MTAGARAIPTAADAAAFLELANARLLAAWIKADTAAWAQATNITPEHEAEAADRRREQIATSLELAAAAARFDGTDLPDDLARQLDLIKLTVRLPMPAAVQAQVELTRTVAALEGDYGKGRYDGKDLGELSIVMAESRDPDALLAAWRGWRTIAAPMREPFARYVDLANQGARDLGFADVGALWRSGFDMAPDAFAAELDRLWRQVKPLYESLHAFVRRGLARAYGRDKVGDNGPIPAHLVGGMWSHDWGNVAQLVAGREGSPGVDVTALLRATGVDEVGMVRYGERFFTSLGFDPLPQTFWDRSLFRKPDDLDVVCHPTAWHVDVDEDVRMSMCIEITSLDFMTVHHELGHAVYSLAY